MNKEKMTRREREKKMRKDAIMDAALALFSQKGFANVSMQEIANKSEFGVGTLYNFFENKEALFEEIMERADEQIINEVTQVLDGPGTEKEVLSKFIRYAREFMDEHVDIIKLHLFRHGASCKFSKKEDEGKCDKFMVEKIAQIIEQGIEKGIFRDVDPMITSKSLNGILEIIILESCDGYDGELFAKELSKVEKLFIDGLLL